MAEPEIRFCTSADGTNIAYATLGEGPPLVYFTGWPASLEHDWEHPVGRAYYEGLAMGRRLVIFDHRGVGASQREIDDVSLEAQVADIAAGVDHLQLERFDLWGSVDGTAVCVAYAVQHPERVSRLVLLHSYPCGVELARPGAVRSLAELVRENWSLARRAIADVIFPSGPTELQRRMSDVMRQSISPETAARHFEFFTSVDVRPYLPQISAPTLVLHRRGNRDVPIAAGRAVAALIPDARFVALEGDIDHPVFGDTSYVETVTRFLDEGRAETPVEEPGAFRTILFTDMEGSTTLTQRLGDAAAQELLHTHNTIVRDALTAHNGTETKHTGDGIMASFTSASAALEAAVAIQKALAEHNEANPDAAIRVRIGLNAGEPVAEDEDLFGTAVQLAARVCDRAEPGQILVADVVQQLAAGKGFTFDDKGEASLKGFEKLVRLHEVRWHD